MYRILVVDDEPLTKEYMKKNIPLIDSRFIVTCEAMEGTEALTILKNEKIDLIITDIKMPLIDGLELSKEVSENYPDIIIVILSGYDEFEFAKKAMRYGVKDYLLKPLIKEDLRNVLVNVAMDIEKINTKKFLHNTLLSLSEDSKKQISRNFLKAVVSESNMDIRIMYPILFKMKVSLIESEGTILLIKINEDSLLKKSISINDINLFNFILIEIATEEGEKFDSSTAFFDKDDNVAILIKIDEKDNYFKKAVRLFSLVSSAFTKKTGLTLSLGIGEPENDVLQMEVSYKKAYTMLYFSFLNGIVALPTDNNTDIVTAIKNLQTIDKIIRSIQSGIIDDNELLFLLSIAKYVEHIEIVSINSPLRYGIYLINSLKHLLPYLTEELFEKSYSILKPLQDYEKVSLTKDFILSVFNKVIYSLAKGSLESKNHLNENDIVTKAKEYIYLHYSEPISLALLAEKISVSMSYLSSIFHKSMGESYIKFLTRIRMEEATNLLKITPRIKILEISEKVGYVSSKHFSCIFKSYFNITPGDYQENYFNKKK
jgi:two-component system response regulator YesN